MQPGDRSRRGECFVDTLTDSTTCIEAIAVGDDEGLAYPYSQEYEQHRRNGHDQAGLPLQNREEPEADDDAKHPGNS